VTCQTGGDECLPPEYIIQHLKLGDTHAHTLESMNNLIDLYEARNKPEKADEWRAKLPQTEATRE